LLTTVLCSVIVLLAGVLGGGQGGPGDAFVQLLALALGGVLLFQGLSGRLAWLAPMHVRCLVLLPLALPLLQMLPLPGSMLDAGDARALLAVQLGQAGAAMPHIISLDRDATESALWSLLPALALFLATLTQSRRSQRLLLATMIVVAIANVFMGMAQEAGGNDSPLRLYQQTNKDQAVGLFANRNHLACYLVMLLPMVVAGTAWAVSERLNGRRITPFAALGGAVIFMLLVIGIALSGSRAGLLLAMVAVVGVVPIIVTLNRQRGGRRVIVLLLGLAVILAMQFSLLSALPRLINTNVEDGRVTYAKTTIAAAKDYMPWGSGLGTFRNAYQPYEAKGEPTRYIINHAHDEYLELWLEGGMPALALLVVGALAWLARGWRILRPRRDEDPASLTSLITRCAWLGASLGLLHSALDFPLRTTSAMCAFAVLAAIAFSDFNSESRASARSPRR